MPMGDTPATPPHMVLRIHADIIDSSSAPKPDDGLVDRVDISWVKFILELPSE